MFYNELPTFYLYSKHSDLWDKHTVKVFSDEMHFKLETKHERDCTYFENVYHKTQLINLFGIISLRIFFNLAKKFIFVTRLKQKERFYKFFLAESRNIFTVVCDNICIDFTKNVLKDLKPYFDYDPTYFKITNSYYIKYPDEKKKCTFLVVLEQVVKKDYPDIEFQFYLSRRSKFAHMGLDVPLISIENDVKLAKFIQDYWEQIKSDDMFSFCTPRLISATKFKFDYIIFQKNIF